MSIAAFDLRLTVTTDGSGDGTDTATEEINAYLEKIHFIDGTLADAHTAVLSVTDTAGGVDETIWSTTAGDTNSDIWVHPISSVVDSANDAVANVYARILVCGKPKLTIASGGATATGGCVLYFAPE